MSISQLIILAKHGDSQCMEELIVKFMPLIDSLSRKARNEYAKTDLIIFFIKFIYKIKINNFINYSEGAIVKYIKNSMYRECYRLAKGSAIEMVELTDTFSEELTDYKEIEYVISLNDLVDKGIITKRQKEVLLNKYCYRSSDTEIASDFHISRQAVAKIHNAAIKNLKTYLN